VRTNDRAVQDPPKSGSYLVVDVTVGVDRDAGSYAGSVRGENFRFTPTGMSGRGLTPTDDAVTGALDWTVLQAGKTTHAALAFDTAAGAGTLTMYDGGGNAIVKWTIGVSDVSRSTGTQPPSTRPSGPTRGTGATETTVGAKTTAPGRRTG
jgi:hypothetical protein